MIIIQLELKVPLPGVETQVLISEGKTLKGMPLEESLMVTDHHAALLFVLQSAQEKKNIGVSLIQSINFLVMRSTGNIYNTMLGSVGSRSGAFIKGNVTVGSSYFPNFDKVERLTTELAAQLNKSIKKPITIKSNLTRF